MAKKEQSGIHAVVNPAECSNVNPAIGIPSGHSVNAGGNKSSSSVKKR